MTKRRGRKRNITVDREPNGRARRQIAGPTPELIERRSELVGAANWQDQRAGDPIGQMELAGKITWRQAAAGQQLRARWIAWARMEGIPEPVAPALGGRPPAMDTDPQPLDRQSPAFHGALRRADRIRTRLDEVQDAAERVRHGRLGWEMVKTLCVESLLPPRLLIGWHPERRGEPWHPGWTVLRNALDAIGDVLGLPDEIAA